MLDYLQIYPQTIDMLKRYREDQRCRLYEAMARYAFTGEEPAWPDDAPEWLIWEALRQQVDRADQKVKTNKRNASQREKQDTNKSEQESTEAKPSEPERLQANSSETDNQEPRTKNKETGTKNDEKGDFTPPKPPANKTEADFAVFWEIYPRKEKKKDALAAWMKLKPAPELQRKMILAVQARRASPEWQRENGRYIPHPAAWINGRRWEDQPTEIKSGPGKRVGAQMYAQRDYTEEELSMGVEDELIAAARAHRNKEADTG